MAGPASNLLVGVDIGGTFTDCVALDRSGRITATKAPSTPGNFAEGMLAAMRVAAERLGLSFEQFCSDIAMLTHGTTVGTNALIQRKGAKVGLITTQGHADAIHIMRGSRGVSSRDIARVVHFPSSQKPVPIVPKRLIEGVSERVDCFGEVVVPLNESQAEDAIRRLVEQGVEAIGVCFLWSFKYPQHEQRVKEMIEKIAPTLFVSCSTDIAPRWGEYERVTATALNAYIGPVMAKYLANLDEQLKKSGYQQPLQITQCGGGSISVDRAIESPLLTLDSGPVSGVTGSLYLGKVMDVPNIITTDMGGTSFDVGIIYGGQPAYSFVSNVAQYEYFLPKVDIQAIGSGGGSLARVDPAAKTLSVGPESAGADPGPACYGKGGTIATVTDADVVLGYINPDNFLGGRIKLDRKKAVDSVQRIASALGLSLMEAASGIARIAEFKMADIIRRAKSHRPAEGDRLHLVRLRRRVRRHLARLRAGRHPGEPVRCGAGERLARGAGGKGKRADGPRRHRRAAAALSVLARHAPQGPDQRGRGDAAGEARQDLALGTAAPALLCALRAVIRERFVLRRGARGDRDAAPARHRRDSAAEALGDEKTQREDQSKGGERQA